MKSVLFGIAALVAMIGTPALAADMPLKAPPLRPPPCVWCGWYMGANGGYGWEGSTGRLDPNFPTANSAAVAVAGGFIPSSLANTPRGGFGGGQIGYNWQNGKWVWGLEADFQGSGIQNSSTVVFPGSATLLPSTNTASNNLNWFGTGRVRAGVLASPNVLLYGTGGFAYGHVGESIALVGNPVTTGEFFGSGSANRVGWSAGAGAEWMVTNNISIKAEYLFVDLGQTSVTTTDPIGFSANFFNYDFKNEFSMVRAGINWHFGGPM
jgi:outer membrane immunogenic protein